MNLMFMLNINIWFWRKCH